MEPSVSASALLTDLSVLRLEPAANCYLVKTPLQEGIELLLWKGELDRPLSVTIHDDSDRIHFSYSMLGCSECWFEGGIAGHQYLVDEDSGSINFNPGRRGRFCQHGKFESVTVMVRPDLLMKWAGDLGILMKRAIGSGGCFLHNRCSAELRSTAQSLGRAIRVSDMGPASAGKRSTLWMLGQSLAMVGLVLEAQELEGGCTCDVTLVDRQRLLRARGRLLADLSVAPTIAELAQEAGLSVLKVKRGFRQLFNNSVYGLFQQERMHDARRRLCANDASVMAVAADLGYTNASHFAAAFHKQFGVNPSALKRRA